MAGAILLMGPTGAGKTDMAIALAATLPVEIVSVDSAMVYRGLDIGSAKPPAEVLARAPHHLVDVCEPNERYSAGEFLRDVRPLIGQIRARGRWPLLVGGTMLYFRALQAGLAELPAADADLRAALAGRAAELGWPALHAELASVDPVAAARIQPRDGQRIQRALEVYALTGTPLSQLQQQSLKTACADDALRIVLAPSERSALDGRLGQRFDAMLAAGLLEEVRQLWARGDLAADLPAIRSVGYRQLWSHLAGDCSLQAARDAAVIATRQLAKRQYTWLRAETGAAWFDPFDAAAFVKLSQFVTQWIAAQQGT